MNVIADINATVNPKTGETKIEITDWEADDRGIKIKKLKTYEANGNFDGLLQSIGGNPNADKISDNKEQSE